VTAPKTAPKVEAVGAQIAAAMADAIEGDPGRWTRMWNTVGSAIPHNPVSGVIYSGINRWVLAVAALELGYPTGAWATYRQWQSAECQVQRGNHGVYIVRAFERRCCKEPDCERGSLCESRPRWGMSVHTVFNAGQVDGDVPTHERFAAEFDTPEWDHQAITDIFRPVGAQWSSAGGDRAYYSRNTDTIHTPVPEAFHTAGAYAATVAHEHVHWTGHPSRLCRPYFESIENAVAEGARAREELVAELGSVVVCNSVGLEHEPVANHAAYLQGFVSQLRSDDGPALIYAASTAATKAAAYIVTGIEAHRSRDDTTTEQSQHAPRWDGQLALLPAAAAVEPTRAGQLALLPAAAEPAGTDAMVNDNGAAAAGERRCLPRWVEAAEQVAALMGMDPDELTGTRGRRAMEVAL